MDDIGGGVDNFDDEHGLDLTFSSKKKKKKKVIMEGDMSKIDEEEKADSKKSGHTWADTDRDYTYDEVNAWQLIDTKMANILQCKQHFQMHFID